MNLLRQLGQRNVFFSLFSFLLLGSLLLPMGEDEDVFWMRKGGGRCDFVGVRGR